MSADPTQPPTPPQPPTDPIPAQPGEPPPDDEGGRGFWAIIAIVVAVLVIAGVVAAVALSGDDEPSQTGGTGPATQTDVTGATAPTGPSATGPTGGTGVTEPTSENLGCGTAAPDTLPDGRYFGFIKHVETASGTMSYDLACFYTGEEANRQASMRGDEVPVPNDVYILNDNPRTRPLTLAPSVELQLIDWNECCETAPGADVDAFATAIDARGFTTIGGWRYNGQSSPYWVTIEGGDVLLIEEQFLP